MDYLIEYYGIGGMEARATHSGSINSLSEHITFIEERGGSSLTVIDTETEIVVYEDGDFVVTKVSADTCL